MRKKVKNIHAVKNGEHGWKIPAAAEILERKLTMSDNNRRNTKT